MIYLIKEVFLLLTVFENIFDLDTADDWDCVEAVERLPALHYNVDLFSCPLGSWFHCRTLKLLEGH